MNIYHAGGKIDDLCYTNCYEAIMKSISNHNNKIYIEIDVMKIKDSYIIAHNDKESIYGCNMCMINLTYENYNSLKVYEKYTPMNFKLLQEIIHQNENVTFILDIKESQEEYEKCLQYIKHNYNDITHKLIPNVYDICDVYVCEKYEFNKCMIGMWKFYDNFYSIRPVHFLEEIQKICEKLNIDTIGVAIDFKHVTNPNFKNIKQCIKSHIYFHGQQNLDNFIVNMYNSAQIYFFM